MKADRRAPAPGAGQPKRQSGALEFAGLIETANPETGAAELMNFYLPAGVTAAGLGLKRVIEEDRAVAGGQPKRKEGEAA